MRITVDAPEQMITNLITGLAQRAGWKPSEEEPTKPVPLPATKPSHRAHPTYKREEKPIIGPNGQQQGPQIIETWEPTPRELAGDIAYEILWREGERGLIEAQQEAMSKLKKTADDNRAVTIAIAAE